MLILPPLLALICNVIASVCQERGEGVLARVVFKVKLDVSSAAWVGTSAMAGGGGGGGVSQPPSQPEQTFLPCQRTDAREPSFQVFSHPLTCSGYNARKNVLAQY